MVEVVATSQDVWKMLKTYSDKHKENQKTTPEESITVEETSLADLYLEDTTYLEETTRSSLFVNAMSDGWDDKVIEIYTRKPVAHCAKITNSGDTALHIAVIGGKKTTVEQLVKLMSLKEADKALRVQNERGYTPLHLAAFVGNASLCDCLASKIYSDEEFRNSSEKIEAGYDILGERNKENETPLFLAVVMGKTDAFLCLHGFVLPRYRDSYYRGNKGDTILHVAISGEYFGTIVDPLQEKKDKGKGYYRKQSGSTDRPSQNRNNNNCPDNYETCFHFFTSMYRAFICIVGIVAIRFILDGIHHDTSLLW
ncbi:hypothetical protein D5086_004446 [Populus alba]|uniref:Uncharacterized protein n=1 Tax=Populus alba TaxID=43335 RepID=A0ACC4CRT8_POPAL